MTMSAQARQRLYSALALAGFFVLWFGAGTVPAVLTSMVISIFPVVVNVATGLASTEPEFEEVLKVLGASRRDVLFNVSLPRALPYLFASLKIAITLTFVGTVLSETVAADRGIGNVMMIASGNFDVPIAQAASDTWAIPGRDRAAQRRQERRKQPPPG